MVETPQEPAHRTDAAQRRKLNRKLRAAFIAGAEDRSRADRGRGLTDEELRSFLKRHAGDVEGP